jgi:hypothetical protein
MSHRRYYPAPDILTDHIVVVKILITAAKLYNLLHTLPPDHPDIKDTMETLQFYVYILMQRYKTLPPPPSRHDEYNSHFQVINLLKPTDIAALILQKATRLHSIYHQTHTIHDDTLADINGYLNLLTTTGAPSGRLARAGAVRTAAEAC